MVRALVLLFSTFVLGSAGYLAVRRIYWMFQYKQVIQMAYVSLWVGIMIVVSLVAELVYKSTVIPPTWRTWLYITGLGLLFLGMIGVALHQGYRGHWEHGEYDKGEK